MEKNKQDQLKFVKSSFKKVCFNSLNRYSRGSVKKFHAWKVQTYMKFETSKERVTTKF